MKRGIIKLLLILPSIPFMISLFRSVLYREPLFHNWWDFLITVYIPYAVRIIRDWINPKEKKPDAITKRFIIFINQYPYFLPIFGAIILLLLLVSMSDSLFKNIEALIDLLR